ncbi:hypothetical protein GGS21DRAFT_493961 [Xylaria nigripes]|nr:hypothetical protein GGS21DRAFT_493961 [Xylaria nigripes]
MTSWHISTLFKYNYNSCYHKYVLRRKKLQPIKARQSSCDAVCEKNDYIIEDLDDSHLLIKDAMVAQLKAKLEERLKETVPFIEDDSGSDRDTKR